jgi:NADH-dependent peroxiredoxin subunit F
MKTYELIIIGGGPAGVAGAVYAARKELDTLLIAGEFGGQSMVSPDIKNWIGTPSISGTDLAKNLEAHAREYDGKSLTVAAGELVASITHHTDIFTVTAVSGKIFQGTSVLIATGSIRRKLDVTGADLYEHKGLTYCATCDGPVFSGADVVVIGGGNAGFESAAQLLAYCKSVTLLHRGAEFKADKITVDAVLAHPNMRAYKNVDIQEIVGDVFVTGVVFKEQGATQATTLPVTGVFVEIGQIPATDFARDIVERDTFNKIIVDPKRQRTSTPGIWAAGDCTDGLYHQNNIAAGDAVKAIEDLYLYLKTT